MLGLSEEECVVEAVADACLKWQRADESWDAVTWAIARDPQTGAPLTEEGNVRIATWSGAKSIGMPDIEVIYRITLERIEILEAIFTEPTYAFSGKA